MSHTVIGQSNVLSKVRGAIKFLHVQSRTDKSQFGRMRNVLDSGHPQRLYTFKNLENRHVNRKPMGSPILNICESNLLYVQIEFYTLLVYVCVRSPKMILLYVLRQQNYSVCTCTVMYCNITVYVHECSAVSLILSKRNLFICPFRPRLNRSQMQAYRFSK